MNLFDNIQNQLYDVTTNVFGYDATWTPSGGGAQQTARVHFKKPTRPYKSYQTEYNPFEYLMEFKEGDFAGLVDAVRSGSPEPVEIEGKTYYCRELTSEFDGKTYYMKIELQP
jgi:hypothetical protein